MRTKNDGKKFGLLVLLSLSLLGEPMEFFAGKVDGRHRSTIVEYSICKKNYLEQRKYGSRKKIGKLLWLR